MNTMKVLLLTAMLLTVLAQASEAVPDGIGIGIIAGEPTGITIKKATGVNRAVDLALAWSFNRGTMDINGSYVIEKPSSFNLDGTNIPFYYGIGFTVDAGPDASLGIRVPLGINHYFRSEPVEVFVEAAPGLSVMPESAFILGAAIGARYYFH